MNSFRALIATPVNRFQSRKILPQPEFRRLLYTSWPRSSPSMSAKRSRSGPRRRYRPRRLAVYTLAATLMESDLRRGLGWPAQHAMVNMWMTSAFIVDCARATRRPDHRGWCPRTVPSRGATGSFAAKRVRAKQHAPPVHALASMPNLASPEKNKTRPTLESFLVGGLRSRFFVSLRDHCPLSAGCKRGKTAAPRIAASIVD